MLSLSMTRMQGNARNDVLMQNIDNKERQTDAKHWQVAFLMQQVTGSQDSNTEVFASPHIMDL